MPLIRPEILHIEERNCIIKDIYNIDLALHMTNQNNNPAKDLVPNDVNFNKNVRIFILAGPNRGGKTVYTEAVGLAQVLFQAGVYIPCQHAKISPVDSIYVHFPVDEYQTVEYGRLGEESKRLKEIFRWQRITA